MSTASGVDDPRFEVVLEKSGRVLEVSEYSLTQDFTGSTDSFSFTYYSDKASNLKGLELQPVTIRIDDRVQLIGRIDATIRGENGATCVKCEGRDYRSDLVECNVDPRHVLKDGMALQDAILFLFGPCGITGVQTPGERVSARTGKTVNIGLHALTSAEVKDFKPEAGRGLYEVGAELLARFGLTIQSAISRDMIVVQPPTYDAGTFGRIARNAGSGTSNVITSATARRDYSSFATSVLFTGKQGGAAEVGGAKGTKTTWSMSDVLSVYPDEIQRILSDAIVPGYSNPDAPTSGSDGKLYRLLYFCDKQGKTSQQNSNAMMRAISDRLKETLVYECEIRGHVNQVTGYNWTTDVVADIDDDMVDVHEPMWCRSAVLSNSRKAGPKTRLTFIRPSTYQIYYE